MIRTFSSQAMTGELVNILPLADRPAAIQTLARWFCDEWQSFDGRSVSMIETQLNGNLNRDRVPITFLACDGTDVLGTVSLDHSDLPGFDHLSPWRSLYVKPCARSRGIGRLLVQHVQSFARTCAVKEIYLWTPNATRLYEKCGWVTMKATLYNSQPITIMRWPL